jgi:hypothetical protein
MSFKKSTVDELAENELIKQKLRLFSRAEVLASALLYLEYRINYYEKVQNKRQKCIAAAFLLYKSAYWNSSFRQSFETLDEFKFCSLRAAQLRGWKSLECVIDEMKLDSGFTGNMHFKRKAEIIDLFRQVLEEYWQLPVMRVYKLV